MLPLVLAGWGWVGVAGFVLMALRPLAVDDLARQGLPVVAAWRGAADLVGRARSVPVAHSYAALAFFTDGQARMEQSAEWAVSAGDVVLVPAGQAHRMVESQGAGFWGLAFCVPCFAANGAAALLDPFEKVRDGAAAVVRVPGDRHGYLAQLFGESSAVRTGRCATRLRLPPCSRVC